MESDFFSGIHPNVVHFPVALLSTYAVLEIAAIVLKNEFVSKSALLLLCLGVTSAFFAVFTGNLTFEAFQYWTDASKNILYNHQNYATILLYFSLMVCALRLFFVIKKKFIGLKRLIFILFALIILYLVYETGEQGGRLVSKFGVGTDLNFPQETKP